VTVDHVCNDDVVDGAVLRDCVVEGKCRVQPITECDDLCSVALQSPRVQVVRFSGRVALFGCVSLRLTWVCIQTIERLTILSLYGFFLSMNNNLIRNNFLAKQKNVCGSQKKDFSSTTSGKMKGSASWLRLIRALQSSTTSLVPQQTSFPFCSTHHVDFYLLSNCVHEDIIMSLAIIYLATCYLFAHSL
jgi:hypothetical protein